MVTSIFTQRGTIQVQNLIYDYDQHGNLEQRRDLVQQLTENFVYDRLARLRQVQTERPAALGGTTLASVSYSGTTGNIAAKTGVGTYAYGTQQAPCVPAVPPARTRSWPSPVPRTRSTAKTPKGT